MKAKLITFVRGLKNGTPPRFQSYLKSLTLILTLLLSVNVWGADEEKTATWNINGVATSADGTKPVNTVLRTSSIDPSSETGVWTAVSTTNSYAGTSSGAQLGSSSYSFNGTITLSNTKISSNATITKVAVDCKSGGSYTISCKVGSSTFGSNITVNSTTVATKNFTGSVKGNSIVLTLSTSAKKYFNVSKIKVTYTAPIAPNVTSLYLWEAGIQSANLKGTYKVGDSYTLPSTCSQTCGTKTFVGWSTSAIPNPTTKPTSGFYAPGTEVTLAADNNFYAVFADAHDLGGVIYQEVSSVSAGTYVLVSEMTTNAFRYMPNTESTGSNPALGSGITMTTSDGVTKLTNSITNTMLWDLTSTGTANEYYIRPKGSTTIGLGTTTSAGGNIRISGTYKDTKWTITTSVSYNWEFKNNNTTVMYLAVYADDAWRNYKDNTTNQNGKFYLFKEMPNVSYSNYTTSCGPSTYTLLFEANPNGYGTVSQESLADVASGTLISANGSTLKVGSTEITATPTTQTDQYTYAFNEWTGIPNTGKITDNVTITANFTCNTRTYNVTQNLSNCSVSSGSIPATVQYGGSINATISASSGYSLPDDITVTGGTKSWNKTTGALSITNVTGAVSITITAVANDEYYYHGEWDDSWAAKKMDVSADGTYWYWYTYKGDGDRQFKITKGSGWDIAYGNGNCDPGFNCSDITNMTSPSNDWGYGGNAAVKYGGPNERYYIIFYLPNTIINSSNDPKICASTSLPETAMSMAAGHKVYFDNTVFGVTPYFRRGRTCHNAVTNMSLVPGTANLYTVTTTAYANYVAYAIANKEGWADNNSIYLVNTGDGHAITKSTNYIKETIDGDITIVPNTASGTDQGCTYYNYNKTAGMLTHTATITTPSNGTITVAYTDVDNTSKNFTSGNRDLAHTCNLTITATPNTGYQLTSLTVNGSAFTSGNVHKLSADATIAATFSVAQYTLTVASVGDVVITATADGGSAIAEGSSANVDYNKTVTLHYSNLTAGKGLEWNVYKTEDPTTKVTVSGTGNNATFTMPAYPVTVAATISALPTWTITLNTGSGTLASGTTEIVVVQGQSTTLPSCNIGCSDGGTWSFAGWSETNVTDKTTTAPTFAKTAADLTNYNPGKNVTLYAVYSVAGAGGADVTGSSTLNFSTSTVPTSPKVTNDEGSDGKTYQSTWTFSNVYFNTNKDSQGLKNSANVQYTPPTGTTSIRCISWNRGNAWASGAAFTISDGTHSVTYNKTTADGGTSFKYGGTGSDRSNWLNWSSPITITNTSSVHCKVASITIYWVKPGTTTYYHSAPCNEKYTMRFHGVGGDASTIDWTGSLGSEDDYMELNATTITAYPTCATAETGWTFLGWRTSDYNSGKTLDEESGSTDDPDVNTIYKNGKGYALNSGTTSPCGDGVRCVDMYPVFTKFVENDKPDIATLASGSKYYMYYTSDATGYQDDYSSLDGQTTRIYAHTFSSASFSSTTTCASAQLFEFTKRADGNWDIRMRNAADDGYVTKSYIYAGSSTDDTDLYSQATQPDYGWVIETVTINTKTMVKMRYAGNANTSRFMKVWDGGGTGSASGTFKYYSEDCATSTQYHAIYLGSCSNRIFSSNPGHAATWEVYGDFTNDETENFVGYPMTNGMLVVPNLAANTTYQFKLRKTTDDGANYTWFGDTNQGNTYTTSGVEWTLNGENGGHNVNLVTGAAGSYTFTASHMSAEFPGITVTYPTAYRITYAGGDGASGSMSPTINIAAGENVALPTPTFTKTDWNCIGWTADVNVTVNSATVTAGSFIPKTATIQNINSNITLTAVWEQLVITQADRLYEVVVGGTLQLTLTANYSPNITTGATYTWATSDTRFATVDEDGLVTGRQAVNSGEYVTVTSSYGTVSNGYDIVVKSAACEQWGLHYWNTSTGTFGDLCFENVGGDEWRTDQEHLFALPSNSDAEKVKVLYNGEGREKSQEWVTRYVPLIGSQKGECGGTAPYAEADAIGYFRIYTGSSFNNYFLGFQPIYAMTYGVEGQPGWQWWDFTNTGSSEHHGEEYVTEIVQIPNDYASFDTYVGAKRAETNPGVNFIRYRSNRVKFNTVTNLTSGNFAGKFGKFYIDADYCNESNFNLFFVRYYRLHYDLDGGETAAAYDNQFAWSDASEGDRTFALAATPTKEGYTFRGWSVSIGGGAATTMQPGASVTLTDDAVATAIWAQNYTVTYNIGECAGPITHYCGETVTVCDAPEAVTGYTFGGWRTRYKINETYDAGEILQPGTTFVMPCERVVDVVFTAKLTANQYNIIYKDQNNAEFSGKHESGYPKTHTYDSETTLKSATKTGYEFGGWYKDAACEGAVVTTLGATEYTADITLYAKWTANSYHATLNANGGTGEGGFDFTFGGTSVDNFTSTIARAGYDLTGFWSAASGGYQILNNNGTRTDKYHNEWITADKGWVKANNDGVLYAHWTARSGIPYTVEYYQMGLNGNYPATATESKGGTGTAGSKVTPTPKTYTGFTTPDPIEATIAGDGSTVVKYYYVRNQHAFAWEFNGGTPSEDYTPANPTMYYGAPITYPTAITKEGYAFLGWSSTDATMPDADLTITARWAAYENYRTYCGDAVTFYANNGIDPEEEFVITTDNGKITTPTLVETGFTQPEGWVLLGWTKVGDDTKAIVEPGKANVEVVDGDVYNAVWTHIAITGNVLTTSAVGVQVGTTIHVEGTTNNAYGLRVSFVDTKGTDDPSDDVTYGSTTGQTAVAQSDFRLADTGYTYIDGNIIQIGGAAAGDTHNQDYNVVYTPKTANEIDNYVLQIQVMKTSVTALDGALYTLNLKGRALTDNFVIAEYLNDKWYALPADMSGSKTYAGKEITVEGTGMDRVAKNATLDMVYSMKTYNYDKSHVLFQSQFNQGHLWAATGDATGINDNAKTVTGNSPAYSWMPTPQNEALDTYVMSNVNNNKNLVLNNSNTFGMYAMAPTNTNIVYFIPLKAEEYTEKEMMMVEWFPTKVLIEVDEDALTDVRAKVNNVQVAGVTASDTKYGAHQYEITGLNTLVENAAKKLTILYTKNETTYGHEFDIPVIMSNKTYSISGGTTFPWTQAVYNTADLVVRDGSVLTVNGATNTANTFGNVTIYPTSKVIVPAQTAGDNAQDITMTTTTMTLFGGRDEIYDGSEYNMTTYAVPQLVLKGKLVHEATIQGLRYDMRLDDAIYYDFALPYQSKYEIVTDNKGGENFTYWIKLYDGDARAKGGTGWAWYNWKVQPWMINVGTGYLFAAQPYAGQNFIIIRHPMGYNETTNPNGHQSGTPEGSKAAVDVYAHPSTYDNNTGWNFIANPFLANFSKDDETNAVIKTGQLVEHKVNEKWDGHYEWNTSEGKDVRYVTTYNYATGHYYQQKMSEAVLPPFTGFFVQIANEGSVVFDLGGRADAAPARMLSDDELPSEIEVTLKVKGQSESDETVMLLTKDLSLADAREFPAEQTKMVNNGVLNYYTYAGDDIKMYANGMNYEEGQEWNKAGIMVKTAGEYTFSANGVNENYVEQVLLKDMDSNTEYDLMNNDAKIYLDKGEMNDRFYVKIVFGKHNIGTGVTERYDTSAPEKFILNDHMYIRANGVLFDGVGKRVK